MGLLAKMMKSMKPSFVILTAFACVATPAIIIAYIVTCGYFSDVNTDLGYDHYAELPCQLLWLPTWIKMPFNTVVNAGYVAVGLYWVMWIMIRHGDGWIRTRDAFMFHIFGAMAIIYAPIQFTRIITMEHKAAVLDQWFTLPIFAWVPIWSLYLLQGWDTQTAVVIELASCLSYCLSLITSVGFEVALGVHIISSIYFGVKLYRRYKTNGSYCAMVNAICCCVGFVVLKLLDHHLVHLNSIFTVLSGHFWSKIADFMQIHYVFLFFWECMEARDKRKVR